MEKNNKKKIVFVSLLVAIILSAAAVQNNKVEATPANAVSNTVEGEMDPSREEETALANNPEENATIEMPTELSTGAEGQQANETQQSPSVEYNPGHTELSAITDWHDLTEAQLMIFQTVFDEIKPLGDLLGSDESMIATIVESEEGYLNAFITTNDLPVNGYELYNQWKVDNSLSWGEADPTTPDATTPTTPTTPENNGNTGTVNGGGQTNKPQPSEGQYETYNNKIVAEWINSEAFRTPGGTTYGEGQSINHTIEGGWHIYDSGQKSLDATIQRLKELGYEF